MKNKLLQLFSAVGLALGSMRSSRSLQPAPEIIIKCKEPQPELALSSDTPSRGLWLSPFNRAEYRQGRKFRSQRERSNRRKASR